MEVSFDPSPSLLVLVSMMLMLPIDEIRVEFESRIRDMEINDSRFAAATSAVVGLVAALGSLDGDDEADG
jgi:hypothetical protein